MTIDFTDKCVPYEVFMEDLSTRVAEKLARIKAEPDTISQNEAFRKFGRANVERWRKDGKVMPVVGRGKIEYRTADLRELQNRIQNYL